MAFFQRQIPEGTPGLIVYSAGYLVADMVSDAEFEKAIELTEHAIEDGSSISDHAVRRPITGTLTLVQTQKPIFPTEGFSRKQQALNVKTNKPGRQVSRLQVRQKLGFSPNANALVQAGLGALRGAASGGESVEGFKPGRAESTPLAILSFSADAPVDRINAFGDEIFRLIEAVELLTINWKGKSFPGMVLTSVRRSDSAGAGGRTTFACTVQQLVTVKTKQVELPAVPAQRKKKSLGAIKPYDEQFGPPPPPDNRTFSLQLAQGGMSLAR